MLTWLDPSNLSFPIYLSECPWLLCLDVCFPDITRSLNCLPPLKLQPPSFGSAILSPSRPSVVFTPSFVLLTLLEGKTSLTLAVGYIANLGVPVLAGLATLIINHLSLSPLSVIPLPKLRLFPSCCSPRSQLKMYFWVLFIHISFFHPSQFLDISNAWLLLFNLQHSKEVPG